MSGNQKGLAPEPARIELDVVATRKEKWLDKELNVVEELTITGAGVYDTELGDCRVTLTPLTPELKPCPFCGGEAQELTAFTLCPSNTWHIVRCAECHVGNGEFEHPTQVEARAAWNRRAV
jgi:Lar family restriction alleviation protein